MNEIKLLLCPFCESDNVMLKQPYTEVFYVMCLDCCACGGHEDDEKIAVKAWNTRTPSDAKEGNHKSDCATNNEPAFPKGECDCDVKASAEEEFVNILNNFNIFDPDEGWEPIAKAIINAGYLKLDVEKLARAIHLTENAGLSTWESESEQQCKFYMNKAAAIIAELKGGEA